MNRILLASMAVLIAGASAFAAPVTYVLDPIHTHPSFEADHFGGISIWRGRFDSSSGKVVLDQQAKTGTIEVAIDMNSIDFGVPKLDTHTKSSEMFDVEKYPAATYTGKFTKWNGDSPAEAQGTLTMHGVAKPLALTINSFKCFTHPVMKVQVCGADASAMLNRADFGVDYGAAYGFKMDVDRKSVV